MAKPQTTEGQNPQEQLVKVQSEVNNYAQAVEVLVVTNQKEYDSAMVLAGEIKSKSKDIDKFRKFLVDPLNKQVKDINGMFKPQIEAAEKLEYDIKAKMSAFIKLEEAKAVAEQKRLDDIRAAADAKRIEAGKEVIAAPVRQVQEVERTVAVGNISSTAKKVWKFEIESINALPEEVKKAVFAEAFKKGIIDTVVRKLVDAGMHEISGVRVYSDTQIAIKTPTK